MSKNLLKHPYKLPNFPRLFLTNYTQFISFNLYSNKTEKSKSSEYKAYMDKIQNLTKSQENTRKIIFIIIINIING